MSATTRPISLTSHATRRRADPASSTPQTFTIRWEISPAALLASPGAAILNGQAARLKSCSLVLHIDPTTARAELALELIGGERSSIPLSAPARLDRSSPTPNLDHIEAPGLLSATIRTDDTASQILYARTPLLERPLSLPGGVYDAPSNA